MAGPAIPDDLRRFVLTSALTVPHVEAVLLLKGDTTRWDAQRLATRLYVTELRAAELLSELCEKGIVVRLDAPDTFHYQPATRELATLLDLLADTYARHLVEVTQLIHTAAYPVARQFAAAFLFRLEP